MQYSIGGNNRFIQFFRYYIARDGVYAAILSGTGVAIARDGVYAAILSGTGAAIARDGVYATILPGAGAVNVI
ncbi:MAG: hypothetical protein PSU93_02070 [Methylobacter sp.]|uniref:Uncharacterized protein n=1 Tax=Candidatus Methylobacter titanis TaxID=3053457 RepID=A0AA43Q1F0_9GAMM|nr:hypothetical protein [Candidatus Methylobacter titanis]